MRNNDQKQVKKSFNLWSHLYFGIFELRSAIIFTLSYDINS